MILNVVWFVLIAVLFAGFFFLEGFDYGVGMLLPFLAEDDNERRVLINTIGPFWDGNEVWLITAGGAMFAAFPDWYATLFSGFYLALVLMLFTLILRGVAFEFRSKVTHPVWRNFWDWMLFLGSAVPALLWGVIIGNLLRGVPIDANKAYTGTLITLLNPFAVLGGVAFILLFALHGVLYLALRTKDALRERSEVLASQLWLPALIAVTLFIVWAFLIGNIIKPLSLLFAVAAVGTLFRVHGILRTVKMRTAFLMTGLTIIFATAMVFSGLFPQVMISTLNPEWSLTVNNAASSPYTLRVMTVVAIIFVPLVLFYQSWTYRTLCDRLGVDAHLEY